MIYENAEDLKKMKMLQKQPILKTEPTIVQGQEKINMTPKDEAIPANANIENQGYIKRFVPYYIYRPPFGFPRRDIDLLNCRRLAKTPFVFSVIKTLLDEICAAKWDIVPNEGYKEEEVEAEVKKIKEFFNNPNGNNQSFRAILRGTCRDILELDSGVIEKVYNRRGEITQLFTVDGSTILLNPDEHGYLGNRVDYVPIQDFRTLQSQEAIAHYYTNYLKEQAAYFQYNWTGGVWPVPFGKKELIYIMANDNTDSIYGTSPIQVLYNILLILLYGSQVNLDMYANNNIPTGMLVMLDANKDQIEATRQYFTSKTQTQDMYGNQVKQYFNVPISPKEVQYVDFKFNAKDMQMLEQQTWYQKVVWSCYDEQTEILTENGWIYFKDLQDEKVARVNPDSLYMDFVDPVCKQEYDYVGDIIKLKDTRHTDLVITPEHRVLYKSKYEHESNKIYKEGNAIDLVGKDIILPAAVYYEGTPIKEMQFKSECNKITRFYETQRFNITGDLFCKFMGLWLGDGWVDKNRIVICASEKYPENKEYIEDLLKEMGVRYTIRSQETSGIVIGKPCEKSIMYNYSFSNKAFSDYLSQFGKAHNKFIPNEIKNASKEQIDMFLGCYELTDGCSKTKTHNRRWFSMSKRLSDDVQEILIRTGRSANINQHNGGYEVVERYCEEGAKTYSYVCKENITKEIYAGKVYDVTVPDYHYLVVRRNGRVVISGNCFGVTPDEMGIVDNSNRSTANEQSRIFKRKALAPMFKLLEYHLNTQLVWELDPSKKVQFKFDDYDIEAEFRKAELNEKLLNTTWTLNEIRQKDNMEPLEGEEYDKPKSMAMTSQFSQGFDSNMASNMDKNDNEANKEDVSNEERSPEKEDKLFQKPDNNDQDKLIKKSLDDDVPVKTELEKRLMSNYKELEKQIIELVG